jgi:hypothetical protein
MEQLHHRLVVILSGDDQMWPNAAMWWADAIGLYLSIKYGGCTVTKGRGSWKGGVFEHTEHIECFHKEFPAKVLGDRDLRKRLCDFLEDMHQQTVALVSDGQMFILEREDLSD